MRWNEWAVRLLDRAAEKDAPIDRLRGLATSELDILRYEALARLGAYLPEGAIRVHYEKCEWYQPKRNVTEASAHLTVEEVEWMAIVKAFKECDQEWPPLRRSKLSHGQLKQTHPLTRLGQFIRALMVDREE